MEKQAPHNKAVQAPPSLKGAAVLILDDDDVIVITEKEIREEMKNDTVANYIADGEAYLRHPYATHLQKNLTRDQRRALGRRGLL